METAAAPLALEPQVELRSLLHVVRGALADRSEHLDHTGGQASWSPLAAVHLRLLDAWNEARTSDGIPFALGNRVGWAPSGENESALVSTSLRLAVAESRLDPAQDASRAPLLRLMAELGRGEYGDARTALARISAVLGESARVLAEDRPLGGAAAYYADRPWSPPSLTIALRGDERAALEDAILALSERHDQQHDPREADMLLDGGALEAVWSAAHRNFGHAPDADGRDRPDIADAMADMRAAVRIAFEQTEAFPGPRAIPRLLESAAALNVSDRYVGDGDASEAESSLAALRDMTARASEIARDRERVTSIARAQGIFFDDRARPRDRGRDGGEREL